MILRTVSVKLAQAQEAIAKLVNSVKSVVHEAHASGFRPYVTEWSMCPLLASRYAPQSNRESLAKGQDSLAVLKLPH